MRNIFAHPLTTEEAFSVLDIQMQAIEKTGSFGGISGHALTQIKAFLKQNEESFASFLAKKD